MFGWLRKREAHKRTAIPPELIQGIETADVFSRGTDEDDEERVVVRVAGMGMFPWEGTQPAAARILRHWPEIGQATANRAARLLAAQLVSRARRVAQGQQPRRRNWVMDW